MSTKFNFAPWAPGLSRTLNIAGGSLGREPRSFAVVSENRSGAVPKLAAIGALAEALSPIRSSEPEPDRERDQLRGDDEPGGESE